MKIFEKLNFKFKKLEKDGYVPFFVEIDSEKMKEIYLKNQPQEKFREKSVYECNACLAFIKYPIIFMDANGNRDTIYNIEDPGEYKGGFEALHKELMKAKIQSIAALNKKNYFGVDKNKDNETNIEWYHVHSSELEEYLKNVKINKEKSKEYYNTLLKLKEELTKEDIEYLLKLTDEIYRGEQYKYPLQQIMKIMDVDKDELLWYYVATTDIYKYRNIAILNIIHDIRKGLSEVDAINRYIKTVDPQNYKRYEMNISTETLKRMLEEIKNKGLEPALYRKHLSMRDIPKDKVIYYNNNYRTKIQNGILDNIIQNFEENKLTDVKYYKEIEIEKFIEMIQTKNIQKIEVGVNKRIDNNKVALIGPKYEDAPNIFKWDNKFSWIYENGKSDAAIINKKIKDKGGNINAPLRFSLNWKSIDDYDIHIKSNDGIHVYFSNKSQNDIELDVDMNAFSDEMTDDAVENIYFKKLRDGEYKVYINNYRKRISYNIENVEMTVYIFIDNEMAYVVKTNKPLSEDENLFIAEFKIENGEIEFIKLNETLDIENYNEANKVIFEEINIITKSPNTWGEFVAGQIHYLFLIKNTVINTELIGFTVDMIKDTEDFKPIKKAFQYLEDKIKVEPDTEQLSGFGFSKNSKKNVFVRVNGKDVYKIKF